MNSEKNKYLVCQIKTLLFFFLYLAISPFCKAQTIRFNHLTLENGLSQNSVLCIGQDTTGFIWMGTRYGINRYDGTRVKVYKNDRGRKKTLSSNYVLSLLCDSRGTIWAGTPDGINKYDPAEDVFYKLELKSSPAEKEEIKTIQCIYEDKKGTIWIGTNLGLWQQSPANPNSFICYRRQNDGKGLADERVHSIFEDSDGILWIGAGTGFTKMTAIAGGYTFTNYNDNKKKDAMPGSHPIVSITEDGHKNIWLSYADAGLRIYNKQTNSFTSIQKKPGGLIHNNVRRLLYDNKSGSIWAGTQEGLSIIDAVTKKIISISHDPEDTKSLSQNSIHSLFRDRQGITWIGTYFGGVNIVYPSSEIFSIYQNTHSPNSINNNVISSFAEDQKGNLWIGTEGGGLNYFDRATNLFSNLKNKENDSSSLSSNLVKVVYRDKKDNIWIGVHGGSLDLLNPSTNTFRHFYQQNTNNTRSISSAEIVAIIEDSEGNLWTGSHTGLNVLKNSSRQPGASLSNLSGSPLADIRLVTALYEDAHKNIWIGTQKGLYRYNIVTKIKTVFRKGNTSGLLSDHINCITGDAGGAIWIGTYYEGVALLESGKDKFQTFTDTDGLPNNNIAAIAVDNNGEIWVSTSNGLSVIDIEKKKIRTYNVSDGLMGNEFNYNAAYKDKKGELYFGGFNGFANFQPRKIQTNQYKSSVVFTGLLLSNKPVAINGEDRLLKKDISLTDQVVFKSGQDLFTLEYALLNFDKPGKNKYAYKLEGLDKNWTEASEPSVTYTHLPTGNYTLLVKGANNDGLWSQPTSMQIVILPPFWKTGWAYIISILVCAALLFLITRFFFLRELLKKEKTVHQFKLNFFTNISHEIRTYLSLITGPVEQLVVNTNNDPVTSRQLLNVKKNTEALLRLVNEQMDFRKAETGNLKLHISLENICLFIEDIYHSFQDLALARNIKTDLVCETEDTAIYLDKEQMHKVFFNLLSNAFKFTPDGGQIKLLIKDQSSGFRIQVIDNGKGIAAENLSKLFTNFYQVNDHNTQNTGYGIGLALSKSIVELHKGNITVESETTTNKRTTFTVTLLKGKDHFDKTQVIFETRSEADLNAAMTPVVIDDIISPNSDSKQHDKTFSILVVDDNAGVRTFITESLNNHYHIIEDENGLKGLQTATQRIPDLIISDVMMPEMDGLVFCHQLKSDERTSHIPVILLTAKSATDNYISGLEMGADIYLTKPFSIQVLSLHIRNLLSTREKIRQRFESQERIEPDILIRNETVTGTVDQQFLSKAIEVVEEHIDNPDFGVEMMARKVAMSPPILYKKLKAVTNMSVNEFIKSLRMQRACSLLKEGKADPYDIAYMVGYKDKKYFTKEFKKHFGKSPTEYVIS